MDKRYYENKSVNYGMGHTRRRKILELIDGSGLRVLDVACASGYLGERVKKAGNYVEGLEISEAAVQKAQQVLDAVFVGDVQHAWPTELRNGGYDLIIMAEILEHVFDPLVVLRQAHEALRNGGSIIITTPNFLAWKNRIKFLFGKFAYTDQGIFDFGHIRWFTWRYLKTVLDESGFKIIRQNHIIYPGKLTWLLSWWPSLFASQFIIKANKI
jgi:2-polyprenyl-3-methyl-5-hydroxy-6-metoxy-1,4-benzoquinol methylase